MWKAVFLITNKRINNRNARTTNQPASITYSLVCVCVCTEHSLKIKRKTSYIFQQMRTRFILIPYLTTAIFSWFSVLCLLYCNHIFFLNVFHHHTRCRIVFVASFARLMSAADVHSLLHFSCKYLTSTKRVRKKFSS